MTYGFDKVYEFVEQKHMVEPFFKMDAPSRLSVFGLYRTYVLRELRRSTKTLYPYIRQRFGEYLPEELLD